MPISLLCGTKQPTSSDLALVAGIDAVELQQHQHACLVQGSSESINLGHMVDPSADRIQPSGIPCQDSLHAPYENINFGCPLLPGSER